MVQARIKAEPFEVWATPRFTLCMLHSFNTEMQNPGNARKGPPWNPGRQGGY